MTRHDDNDHTRLNGPDELEPCDRCGQRHQRQFGTRWRRTCSSHKVGGEPCLNLPLDHMHVCQFHGGNAPQTQRLARQRAVDESIDRVLRLVAYDPALFDMSKTPAEQLLEEVARSAYMVHWLGERVAELTVPNPDDAGAFENVVGVDGEGNEVVAQPRFDLWAPRPDGELGIHPLWKKFDEERDRHARMCKIAIDAGISERLVRLAEAQGQQLVAVVVYVLDGLGLTANQRERGRRLAAEKMRALSTGVIDV